MRNRSVILTSVILVSAIVVETHAYANPISSHTALTRRSDDLNADYDSLSSSFRSLETAHTELSENFSRLSERHQVLQLDHASLGSEHSRLEIEHLRLESNYTSLQSEFQDLQSEYAVLEAQHSALQSEHEDLQSEYTSLESDHASLEAEHQTLESEYKSLEKGSETLETANKNLRLQYDQLRKEHNDLKDEYDEYVTSYLCLVSEVNLHWRPSSDAKKFITPHDSAIASRVEEITGGWSDTSNWNEYWTDVKALYDWVVNNIGYRFDGLYPTLPSDPSLTISFTAEMWQFPNQTLSLKRGDCEDMSVLLASMMLCYDGGRHFVECVIITGHMAVYMPVAGGEICILDPAGQYYTNTGAPLRRMCSEDIRTEVNAWLSRWDSSLPENAPHRVEAVFSTSMWQQFDSTQEFINWLYSR